MADAWVDVELVPDLALDYAAVAEAGLQGEMRDAWDLVAAAFPGITLVPLFASLDVALLADMVDAVRMQGEEPPDPFAWFGVPCEEAVAEPLRDALALLPFVVQASIRLPGMNAGVVAWGTNRESPETNQVMRAPVGVNAIHAWQVEGGTGRDVNVADIENGWDLSHEDLLLANATRVLMIGPEADVTHGSGALGILVASDNGAGIVGIVPNARAFLVNPATPDAGFQPAAAIAAAAAAAGHGGIVLIEQALNFHPRPNGERQPDLLWEFNPATQQAIRLATMFGVTVVEPAGNGHVNLDAFPILARVQPGSPSFVDSRAIVVGAGAPDGEYYAPTWGRANFSTYGARVDCFASGRTARAPGEAPDRYQWFGGTSGASAIVAGVVCSLQGMSLAATGQVLGPTDFRRLFRDPALGTPTASSRPGGIGFMPDLRRLARHLGFPRILPVTLVSPAAGTMTLVHLDDGDTFVRRDWRPATDWGTRIVLDVDHIDFSLLPGALPLIATWENAASGIVAETVGLGIENEVHHLWWDEAGQSGRWAPKRSIANALAPGCDLAMARPSPGVLAIVGVDLNGRLVELRGDAASRLAAGVEPAVVVDAIADYAPSAGPVVTMAGDGTLDVFAIDAGGNLRWARWTALGTLGAGWLPAVTLPSPITFDVAVRPAAVATEQSIVIVARGTDMRLYGVEIGPVLPVPVFHAPVAVDPSTPVGTPGPLALTATATALVAVAVGADRRLKAATRLLAAGSPWSALMNVDSDGEVSPLGGASAAFHGAGVAVAAVMPDGRPCWSELVSNIGWLPLRPV